MGKLQRYANMKLICQGRQKYARLCQGILFEDDIAAQQQIQPDAHPTQYRKQKKSRQFWGSGDMIIAG